MNVFYSVNGQYLKQGKLGAAVLGNHANKEVRFNTFWVVVQGSNSSKQNLQPLRFYIIILITLDMFFSPSV